MKFITVTQVWAVRIEFREFRASTKFFLFVPLKRKNAVTSILGGLTKGELNLEAIEYTGSIYPLITSFTKTVLICFPKDE